MGSVTPVADGSGVLGSVLSFCPCCLPSARPPLSLLERGHSLLLSPRPRPPLHLLGELPTAAKSQVVPTAGFVLNPSVAHSVLLPHS